nr:ABC transporter substrate-binding protein [uncultured Cetobacterium sp.]
MKKFIALYFIIFIASFSMEIKNNRIYGEHGESVELKEYKRILVYNLGAVETLFEIGAGENIVGIANHRAKIWPEEKTKNIPTAGPISKPSIETIMSFNPDIVLFNVMGDKVDELNKVGIPSLVFANRNLDDIKRNTLILGAMTGKESESQEVVKKMEEKLEYIKKNNSLKGKAVILYSDTPPTSFSKNSLPVEILKLLGLEVVVPAGGKKAIISPEYILSENPDYIIGTRAIKSKEEILNSIPLIEETKAYKSNNIYQIDSTVILRASHRVFDEIEKLYEILKGR